MEQTVHKKIVEMENVSFVYDGEELPVWQGLNCYFEEGTVNLRKEYASLYAQRDHSQLL